MRDTARNGFALVKDSIWTNVENFISTGLLPAGDAAAIEGDLGRCTTGMGESDSWKTFPSRDDFYMAWNAKLLVQSWDVDLNVRCSIGDDGCCPFGGDLMGSG